MTRIAAVALNTFREAVRDRVLYGLIGVAVFVLAFTLVLAEMSLDQHRRIVLDVGLASISFFSVVVAVFLGSSLLYKEIERKTLYVILPKPIHRYEFLLGKYFGIVLTAFVFIAVMGAVQLIVVSIQAEASLVLVTGVAVGPLAVFAVWALRAHDRTAVIVPCSLLALVAACALTQASDVELPPVLAALTLNIGEVLLLTAVALLFSSFSTPFLTALFSIGVWLVGRSADTMVTVKSDAIPDAVKELLHRLVLVWPNFNLFVPGRHTLTTQLGHGAGPLSYVVNNMAYSVAYSTAVLIAASLIFRRRDFL